MHPSQRRTVSAQPSPLRRHSKGRLWACPDSCLTRWPPATNLAPGVLQLLLSNGVFSPSLRLLSSLFP